MMKTFANVCGMTPRAGPGGIRTDAGMVAVAAVAAMPALSSIVSTVFAKIGNIISSSVN